MRIFLASIFVAFAVGLSPSVVRAQTTIGDPGPGSSMSWASAPQNGQTFTVPAGVTTLNEVKVAVNSPGPFTVSLHERTGVGAYGPALASVVVNTNASTQPNYALYGPTLSGGGIAVTPGQTYVILTDGGVPVTIPAYYPDGEVVAGGEEPAYDAYFTATFDAPTPASVPTLSEWAMILLAIVLASGAAALLHRRFQPA